MYILIKKYTFQSFKCDIKSSQLPRITFEAYSRDLGLFYYIPSHEAIPFLMVDFMKR